MATAPFFDPSRPSMGSQQPFGFFNPAGGGATAVQPPTGSNPAGNPQQGGQQGFVPPSLAGQPQFQGGGGFGGFNPQFGQSQLGGDARTGLATGLHNVTNRAEDLFQAGPRPFFPGQTVAPFNPFQQQAAQGAFDLSGQSAPLNQAAFASAFGALNPFAGGNFGASQLGQFARGDFTGQNPFIQDVFNQQVAPAIRENVNTPFLQGGRFGSAANTRTLGRELGNAATNLFGANFAEEQRNRLQASNTLANLGLQTQGQIPGLVGGGLQNQFGLFDLGTQFQNQQQQQIQGQRERFEFGRDDPSQRLQQLFSFLNPQNIGQFERTNVPGTGSTQNFLSAATGGLNIANQIRGLFSGPQGG